MLTGMCLKRSHDMPDYGHDLEFGYFQMPDHGDVQGTLGLSRLLDELGYDLIGIQDHPYHRDHFDALALIATILAQTERVRVFPDVANLALRPPSVLAKTAASLDQLSGGRFELGLGSGGFQDAIHAFGGPRRTPAEAAESLIEAVEIIRLLWSGQRGARFEGEHYHLAGAQPGPLPAHDMSIWLGVGGPRMLRLIGRAADGWIPSMAYFPPAATRKTNTIFDEAARAAGRDPAEVVRLYNVSGVFAQEATPFTENSKQISGPPEHWAEVLANLTLDQGFSKYILWTPPEPEALRLFIQEVAPAVRERVAAAR
jgi:alkanesulfonate monooxygenase SsuD/methylene tetrahydromethanopterin reductase-like flavin-dependent oxidoreductase (luciferase family)